jgi:hypothetical protein
MQGYKRIINKLFLFFIILFIGLTFSNQAIASYEIPLFQGWNLISLPEQQTNTKIEVVTASIEGKFSSIWGYKDGQWYLYVPSSPGFTTLFNMDAGNAYYIQMNSSGTLVGSGLRAGSTIQLNSGWNLVGYNSKVGLNIVETLASTEGAVTQVWAMINGNWKLYDVANPNMSDLSTMEPGYGYWLVANRNSSLSIELSIPATTKSLDEVTLALLYQINANQIIFDGSSSLLASLNIGDIIVSSPIDQAPNGFLRKIVSIDHNGSRIILNTVDATLDAAIEKGTCGTSINASLDPNYVASLNQIGKNGIKLAKRELNADGSISPVSFTVNYEHDFGDGRKVKFEGEVEFQPEFLIHYEMQNFQPKEFQCSFTGTVDSNIKVYGFQEIEIDGFEVDLDDYFPQLPIKFSPIVVWAGYVPIVFTPELTVLIGLDGKIGLGVSTKVGVRSSTTLGIRYSSDDGYHNVKNINSNIYHDPFQIEFDFNLKAFIGPKVDLFVYGFAGPYFRINGFLETAYESTDNELKMYAGLEFQMGLEGNNQLNLNGNWDVPVTVDYKVKIYPENSGHIAGNVKCEAGGLSGVSVVAKKDSLSSSQEYPAVTDTNGNYTMDLPTGYYASLTASKLGYNTVTMHDITIQSDTIYNAPQIVMVVTGLGKFSGQITDAITGQPVAGAEILFRSGIGNVTGGILSAATTDATGNYKVESIVSGYYTGEVSKVGYITNFFTSLCTGETENLNQNGVISPMLDTRQIRIVLTWGASPYDLDSHLTGPIPNSTTRFHTFYNDRGSMTASPFAYLDHDDVTSYGPETTTIAQVFQGIYRYSVHDFTNRNSTQSQSLAQSSAHIDVYRGNDLWQSFNVPNQYGTLWTVFEYDGSSLTSVNTMEYCSNPSSVNNERSDVELMQNLPNK